MGEDGPQGAVNRLKNDHRKHASGGCAARCAEPWPCRPYRAAAAVEAALEHHQPRQLYGMVESLSGKILCDHDGNYDGDAHFEGDDGLWYCRDKPTLRVCTTCTDGSDGDLWAEWPCPTYKDITRELTGEAGNAKA